MTIKPYVTAVIVAAGNSTRMSCGVSKQLIPLLGKPAISYTLNAFENAGLVNEIIVVCKPGDMAEIREIADSNVCIKVKELVPGGHNRSQSVANGIAAASEQTTHFAIHDGARALILPDDIDRVVSQAFECSAATLGTYVTDTIKIVDDNGVVLSTPDRGLLRAVQTPQVFEKELYLSALAENPGADFTDDCALVESVGAQVRVIMGDSTNIKLTTQSDIPLAESVLKLRYGR